MPSSMATETVIAREQADEDQAADQKRVSKVGIHAPAQYAGWPGSSAREPARADHGGDQPRRTPAHPRARRRRHPGSPGNAAPAVSPIGRERLQPEPDGRRARTPATRTKVKKNGISTKQTIRARGCSTQCAAITAAIAPAPPVAGTEPIAEQLPGARGDERAEDVDAKQADRRRSSPRRSCRRARETAR